MASNFYCLDNDIILKLATCNLFEPTIETLDTEYSKIAIIDTFRYNVKKKVNRKKSNSFANYNIENALKITEKCAEISKNKVDQQILLLLENIEGIDLGEAILISYVAYQNQHDNSSYLLTGDKRCLKALYNFNLTEVTQCLEHKIWSLEQLILRNIEKFGFDFVKNNVFPVRDCDIVLKAVFGSGELSTSENSIHTLRGYINVLRHETGNLLHPYPD